MGDNSELKRAAEAASQGHWNQDGFEVQNDDINDYRVARCNRLADAKFIAAANPVAVLALIAENDRLTAELDCPFRLARHSKRLVEQLREENEALRKERDARHPFKPSNEPAIGYSDGCMVCGQWGGHFGLPRPKTRATADAAMGKGDRGVQSTSKTSESTDPEGSRGGVQ